MVMFVGLAHEMSHEISLGSVISQHWQTSCLEFGMLPGAIYESWLLLSIFCIGFFGLSKVSSLNGLRC